MSLIKYLGRRALLNVIIIINIYSFNLGAYEKNADYSYFGAD